VIESERERARERERGRDGEGERERERERECNAIMRTSIVESKPPHPLLTCDWNLSSGGRQSSWVCRKERKAPASLVLSRLWVVAKMLPSTSNTSRYLKELGLGSQRVHRTDLKLHALF